MQHIVYVNIYLILVIPVNKSSVSPIESTASRKNSIIPLFTKLIPKIVFFITFCKHVC